MKIRPSSVSIAAPTRKFEYGAYADALAATAAAIRRSSDTHHLREERGPGQERGNTEVIGDRLAEVGEGPPPAERHRPDPRPEGQHGDHLARVVGRGGRRVVPVI